MGSCVSVHKGTDSAMRLSLSFGSKTDKLVSPSPVDVKPVVYLDRTIADIGFKPSLPVRDLGSKEENFFDSKPWLESDCDDDFFSVNGDFTPSRGSTPTHHSFFTGIQETNKITCVNGSPVFKPEPSPTAKKKKLIDFFKESPENEQDEERNTMPKRTQNKEYEVPPKSMNGTPSYLSGANSLCSSERTPNSDIKADKKSVRFSQCCLPMLFPIGHNHDEKRMSPASNNTA